MMNEGELVMNGELLEKLDTALDTVDAILNDMALASDVKKALVSQVYKLYADAEEAVEVA
jgi:hypothetical protein